MKIKKIFFITPTLNSGGSERVIASLSNYLSVLPNYEIGIILYTNDKPFYSLNSKVKLYYPKFDYKKYSRFLFTLKLMLHLRNVFIEYKPNVLISFGGRYNSFNILSLAFTGAKIFISERSRPGISYGLVLDLFNKITYRFAAGIISQTTLAANNIYKKFHHNNIRVISNPVESELLSLNNEREFIILNVGRFIKSKNQSELIFIFSKIKNKEWKLYFAGEGPELENCKILASNLGVSDRVFFVGNQSNLLDLYRRSSIFAFTSESEGFPNALVEAMANGCVAISYDCNAGPSEIIIDGYNGYLIRMGFTYQFIDKLTELIKNHKSLDHLRVAAVESMLKYSIDNISNKFTSFIFQK